MCICVPLSILCYKRLEPWLAFFTTQQEYYNASRHSRADAVTSLWNSNEEIVYDRRLKCIMKSRDQKFTAKGMAPMIFHVYTGRLGRLKVDLWWCEQHFPNSSPLKDADGNVRAGIRSYPDVFADIPNLSTHGFAALGGGGTGGQYFEVKTRVEMTGPVDSLALTVHVMKNRNMYPREAGTRP